MDEKELKPGRELDALVAERVMGWALQYNGWVRESAPRGYSFEPSTNIADAWDVVEKMKTHAFITIEWSEGWWKVDIGVTAHVASQSAPHAICLAALKAVSNG